MDEQVKLVIEQPAILNDVSYMGNINLKPEGISYPWSLEMQEEYDRCKKNPIYFCKNYMKVNTLDHGIQPFVPYPFQEKMMELFTSNSRVCIKSSRQSGKTTSTAAWILWYALFHPDKTIGILANKATTAQEILYRIQTAYEHVPKWMQAGIRFWNKTSLTLENGSRIISGATSNNAIRGFTLNCLFIDEVAFIPPNTFQAFYTSVLPTLSSGTDTKLLLVSTPNGLNHFYEIWQGAIDKINGYVPFEVDWRNVPGRDEKWRLDQLAAFGGGKKGQLKFLQEHCCAFIGSSNTLLPPAVLEKLFHRPSNLNWTGEFEGLSTFEPSIEDHRYMMSVDVSKGVGGDFSTFSIFDISEQPYKQVASYRNNLIAPMLFPNLVKKIATVYNNAHVLIETNTSDIGNVLWYHLEYENVLWVSKDDKGNQCLGGAGNKAHPGLQMSKKSKAVGCDALRSLLESGQLILNDQETISELFRFVRSSSDLYAAEEGYHDDLVMTLVIFAWATSQPYWEGLAGKGLIKDILSGHMGQFEDVMNSVPFFFVNGINDSDKNSDGWTEVPNPSLMNAWSIGSSNRRKF